jgi:hypothetical protein
LDSILTEVVWDEVDSSNIKKIAYHEDSKRILVEFKDDGIYAYDDCDNPLYERFKNAPSVGKFFHANIKNHTSERLN